VGCLIPDSHYRPEFDNAIELKRVISKSPELTTREMEPSEVDVGIHKLQYYRPFAEALLAGGVDVSQHSVLLRRLQSVHDMYCEVYDNTTADQLEEVARSAHLNTDAIVRLTVEEVKDQE
jgi:hypothetical protein